MFQKSEIQLSSAFWMPISFLLSRSISFTTPAPERARLREELQQLYAEGNRAEILAQVDACLPKDAAGNFIAEQEQSDVVHDLLARSARSAGSDQDADNTNTATRKGFVDYSSLERARYPEEEGRVGRRGRVGPFC
jgi:hypothetical protein